MRIKLARTGIALLIIVSVALAVMSVASAVAVKSPTKLVITLRDNKLTVPTQRLRAGEYQVVVKNFSKTPRGVQISGKDKAGTAYVRYSQILARGATGTFNWFFPRGRNVVVKDVLTCNRDEKSCIKPEYGGHSATLRFR